MFPGMGLLADGNSLDDEKLQNIALFALTFIALTTVGQSLLDKVDPTKHKEKEERLKKEREAEEHAAVEAKKAAKKEKRVKSKKGRKVQDNSRSESDEDKAETTTSKGEETKEVETAADEDVPKTRSWFPYIILVVGFFQYVMTFIFPDTNFHVTITEAQPWVASTESFMTAASFHALKADFTSHLSALEFVKNEEAFDTGFVRSASFSFTEQGRTQAEALPLYQALQPLLGKATSKEATAWTVRVLAMQQDTNEKDAVARHRSVYQACNIPLHAFVAHQANVLFVHVPEDIVGGLLEVFPNRSSATEPVEVVEAVENTMVEVRGDAFQKMAGFRLPGGEDGELVAVVLEQYRIESAHVQQCAPFLLHSDLKRQAK